MKTESEKELEELEWEKYLDTKGHAPQRDYYRHSPGYRHTYSDEERVHEGRVKPKPSLDFYDNEVDFD